MSDETTRAAARAVSLADYLPGHEAEAPAGSIPGPVEPLFTVDEATGYGALLSSFGVHEVTEYQNRFIEQSRPLLESLGFESAQVEMGWIKSEGADVLPAWARLAACGAGLAYTVISLRAEFGAPLRFGRRGATADPAGAPGDGVV